MVLIHVVGIHGLVPDGKQTFIVERSHLVDTAKSLIGLSAAGVVVRDKQPMELTADTVFHALGQHYFLFEQTEKLLLGVVLARMVAQGAPCAIFAIEQLVLALQLIAVIVDITAIGATPVLDDIPVGTLTAVASGDKPLSATTRIHLADDIATLLGKVLGQGALILQSP